MTADVSSAFLSMKLRLAEEILYDLPPLEGVFLHWHTCGLASTTPGICSLFSRREQMLGAATLPGASIRLLYECATDCLHRLPGPCSSRWERRPLHARVLRHAPACHPASRQALLSPGVLAHQTLSLPIGGHLLLCSGAGTRSLTHRQVGAMATALALPYRTVKHSLLASYSSHFADSGTMLPPGLTSPFLHPQRLPPLLALVLLPWQACWEAQEREVAISLSLWESLLLPVRCLRPLLRRYARCAYPRVRLIELDHGVPLTTLPRCLMAVSTPLRRLEHPHLHGHRIQYSDALHLLVIDETVIPCTPTEYHVLQVLLQRAGEGVSINHLLGRSAQEAVEWHTRRNLTQHISRLRARLWPFDLDILCLIGYGYLLLSRSQEPATAT